MIRTTERLVLEPIGPQHADELFRIHNDPKVAEWYALTREQAENRATGWGEAWHSGGVGKWLAYERETGDLVGRGGLSRLDVGHVEHTDDFVGVLEIGWAIIGAYWGRGYATEIGRAGLSYAFDVLDEPRVIAFTESRNERSRAVMERLDMRLTGEHMEQGEMFAFYEKTR